MLLGWELQEELTNVWIGCLDNKCTVWCLLKGGSTKARILDATANINNY